MAALAAIAPPAPRSARNGPGQAPPVPAPPALRTDHGYAGRSGLDRGRAQACHPGVVWREVAQSLVLARPPHRLRLELSTRPEGLHVALRARRAGGRGTARTTRIDSAQAAPEPVLLAEEAASWYRQATLMRVGAPRGPQPGVAADPGRAKTSVYGTLHLRTGAELVMPADTMNAQTPAEHRQQLRAAHADGPVLRLWDRAPWQRGEAMREVRAGKPRLEIVPFPGAAPEVNPQAHVGNATRQAVRPKHTEPPLATLARRFTAHWTDATFPTSFLEHRGFYTVQPRSI